MTCHMPRHKLISAIYLMFVLVYKNIDHYHKQYLMTIMVFKFLSCYTLYICSFLLHYTQ